MRLDREAMYEAIKLIHQNKLDEAVKVLESQLLEGLQPTNERPKSCNG
jgi:hypothetical protein